jgi:O-antigen/teichoic acid export membrane protein
MLNGHKLINILRSSFKTSEVFYVVTSQILFVMLSFVLVKILTNNLSISNYGYLALILTLISFFTQVFLGGINASFSRYYSISISNVNIKGYANSLRKLIKYLVSILFLIILVLFVIENISYSLDLKIFIYAVAFAITAGYSSILNQILNIAKKRASSSISLVLETSLKIFIILMLIVYYELSVDLIILSFLISSLVALMIQHIFVTDLLSANDNSGNNYDCFTDIIKYAVPYIPWTFIIWLQQISDKWFLEIYTSRDDVGGFALLFQIGFVPIIFLFTTLNRLISPVIYNNDTLNSSNINTIIYNYIIYAAFGFGLILVYLSWNYSVDIILLFSHPKFLSYASFLHLFILSGILFGLSEIFLLKMQSKMKVRLLNYVKSILGLFGITINFIGVYFYGFVGLVYSLVIFSLINLISMYYYSFSYER